MHPTVARLVCVLSGLGDMLHMINMFMGTLQKDSQLNMGQWNLHNVPDVADNKGRLHAFPAGDQDAGGRLQFPGG